jgi:NAD(P)-dependent dehydrogenase (short-subunit alcohol dehydrogenase family)
MSDSEAGGGGAPNASEPPVVRAIEESVVVISGGTAGIGLAAARAFAAAGAPRITLLGRNVERGEAARDQVRALAPEAQVGFISADAHDHAAIVRAVGQVRAHAGRIDVLVNSAGGDSIPRLLLDTPLEEVEKVLLDTCRPAMLMTRAVLPTMREQRGGAIINVASDAAKTATPGETLIGGAMAAVVMFSRAAAIEAKRDGVRINAVTPSLVAGTAGTDRLFADPFASKLFGRAGALANLGVSTADDQAALILFLASPAAARLTGQAISLNGGISAA